MTGAGRGPCASHPLAQTILPSPGSSDSESASPTSGRQESVHQWAPVPVNLSPYDGTGVGDRASFISTASSHDLMTHHRVNTTFVDRGEKGGANGCCFSFCWWQREKGKCWWDSFGGFGGRCWRGSGASAAIVRTETLDDELTAKSRR